MIFKICDYGAAREDHLWVSAILSVGLNKILKLFLKFLLISQLFRSSKLNGQV